MGSIVREHQEFCHLTSWYRHAHEGDAGELGYLFFGLVGETGETADAFKKVIRETGFHSQNPDAHHFLNFLMESGKLENFYLEMGDVFWYFTRIIDVLGISLEDLLMMNAIKLYHRCITNNKIDPTVIPEPFKGESPVNAIAAAYVERTRHAIDAYMEQEYGSQA